MQLPGHLRLREPRLEGKGHQAPGAVLERQQLRVPAQRHLGRAVGRVPPREHQPHAARHVDHGAEGGGEERGEAVLGDDVRALHVDLPRVPPVVRVGLGHEVVLLQHAGVVDQDVELASKGGRHLLDGGSHLVFCRDVDGEGHDVGGAVAAGRLGCFPGPFRDGVNALDGPGEDGDAVAPGPGEGERQRLAETLRGAGDEHGAAGEVRLGRVDEGVALGARLRDEGEETGVVGGIREGDRRGGICGRCGHSCTSCFTGSLLSLVSSSG